MTDPHQARFDRPAAIASESARILELASSVPFEARVPSCPDWTFADLVGHLGTVQRFWAGNVTAADVSAPFDSEREPPGAERLATWFDESGELLLAALAGVSEESPCWTWWGEPATAGAVARHQVQEAAVHRFDAELAAGLRPEPLGGAIGHDGVGEFLEIMLGEDTNEVDGEVTLTSTDTGGEWRTGRPGPRSARVSATASDLVLLLYRRIAPSDVEVRGDAALLDELLRAAGTE